MIGFDLVAANIAQAITKLNEKKMYIYGRSTENCSQISFAKFSYRQPFNAVASLIRALWGT